MIKESDIFGGTQWTKEQQYQEEIASLCAQIYNTIESYKKLSRKDKRTLEEDIGQFEFASKFHLSFEKNGPEVRDSGPPVRQCQRSVFSMISLKYESQEHPEVSKNRGTTTKRRSVTS